MANLKSALLSFDARGTIGKAISFTKRRLQKIAEKKPEVSDAKSPGQLAWRPMFLLAIDLWHALSASEKLAWESSARPHHLTGYMWFMSQALRPNPGLYLPLLGGAMQGLIDMDGYAIQDLLDPVNPQDADTEAARDAAIAAALEDCIDSHIHGWDGVNWQKLKVNSPVFHNLRVSIYEGDYPAKVEAPQGDGRIVTDYVLNVGARLFGFNGATFDRLRTFGTGVLKVAKGDIAPTRIRMTTTGRVGVAGAKKLFWVACSPDGPSAEWEIADADAGGSAVVYDHFDTDKHSDHIDFNPPMEFATGIWVEKFDHIKSLVFCYK